MKRILTVLETSGWSAQDQVRGPIYRDLYARHGYEVHYMGRQPRWKARFGHTAPVGVRSLWRWFLPTDVRGLLTRAVTGLNDRRIVALSRHMDVVHLIKTGSTSLGLIRRIRAVSGARIVYDLADALWLPSGRDTHGRIAEILGAVDAVTCDNPYGLEFARQYSSSLHLWPPASQVELFDAVRRPSKPSDATGTVVIGWVGSPPTLFHIYSIWEALEDLFAAHRNLHLRLLGAGHSSELVPPFEKVQWSARPFYGPSEMLEEVWAMDVGLFPLFDVEDARTRGILKALLYMAGEAAVVCSPRGLLPELVRDGENGFLARTRSEWSERLGQLAADRALRARIRAEGLRTVREHYSLQETFDKLRPALG